MPTIKKGIMFINTKYFSAASTVLSYGPIVMLINIYILLCKQRENDVGENSLDEIIIKIRE